MFRDFADLVNAAKASTRKNVLAVAAAEDAPVVDAVLHAQRENIIEPLYIGNGEKIRELLRQRDVAPASCNVIDAADGTAGQIAAELVRDGEAHALMKGMLETRDFLGPIVKEENGLRTGKIMSHIVFNDLPGYHKLIMTTDGGMVMYPTLEDKKHIAENAAAALRAMGYALPKIAALCAIEKVNPKMLESVEGAELQHMNEAGELPGCVVIGPISYDVAMSPEIARHKGFDCPYVGDFDVLLMPNMQAGNILGKSITVTMKASMAGVIVGAKAPAVMASRGSDANEKYYSIAMAALISAGMRA